MNLLHIEISTMISEINMLLNVESLFGNAKLRDKYLLD